MVQKQCECGKSSIKVPCSQPTSSCGKFCGEKLKCGHLCPKMCHKPGECAETCTQQCGKVLRCGHKHVASKCHFPRPCQGPPPEEGAKVAKSPCTEKISFQCKCGNLAQTKSCTGERPGSLLLECDESCAILERNRMLADAFGVDTAVNPVRNTLDPTGKLEEMYTEDLIDLYLSNPAWCRNIEQMLYTMFANQARVRRFPPMRSYERMFVHILSNNGFNFRSESQDLEPHRNVVVYADWDSMSDETYPRKPPMTIAEYITRANIK